MSGDDSGDKPLKDLLSAAFYKHYADQPKFALPPFQSTNEATYKLCLSPRKALARYDGLEMPLAMLQLNRELLADLVQAVALKALWNDTAEHGTLHFAVVPHWVWRSVYLKENSDFWDTGYLETHFPGEDHNYHRWAELFGIRFWPDGLPALPADKENSSAAPTTELDKPAVKRADLDRWYEIFKEVHPNVSEAFALRSAAAMFPDSRVPRQWVRDLRGPQPLGKPKARH